MANRLEDLLKSNKEAFEKFRKVKSKDYGLTVIQDYIPDYTETELFHDVNKLQSISFQEEELNVDQLDSIVGGVFGVIDWSKGLPPNLFDK